MTIYYSKNVIFVIFCFGFSTIYDAYWIYSIFIGFETFMDLTYSAIKNPPLPPYSYLHLQNVI